MKIAAIRLRGHIKMSREHEDTMKALGLKNTNTLVLLTDSQSTKGMILKVSDFITWGEASKETEEKFKSTPVGLRPPKGGFRSLKLPFPKGDLGYRGEKINDLIKKMM